jgi:hypothetical protein
MVKRWPLLVGLGLALVGYAVAQRMRSRDTRSPGDAAGPVGRDERLIGAERFARKGDDEGDGEEMD